MLDYNSLHSGVFFMMPSNLVYIALEKIITKLTTNGLKFVL